MSTDNDLARTGPAPRKLSSDLIARLTEAIVAGKLAPRTRLPTEHALMETFGVSRTVVREAIAASRAEGLVETRHGVGTFVVDVELDHMAQVYQLRMELAVLIGRLEPIPRSEEDLARVRALLARCDELARQPASDQKALARINMDFYKELRAMTGNKPLREISDRLYHLTSRVWLTSVPHLNLPDEIEVFRREIADILAAMELGDLEAVGHIRCSHISMSFRRLQRYAALAAAENAGGRRS